MKKRARTTIIKVLEITGKMQDLRRRADKLELDPKGCLHGAELEKAIADGFKPFSRFEHWLTRPYVMEIRAARLERQMRIRGMIFLNKLLGIRPQVVTTRQNAEEPSDWIGVGA